MHLPRDAKQNLSVYIIIYNIIKRESREIFAVPVKWAGSATHTKATFTQQPQIMS